MGQLICHRCHLGMNRIHFREWIVNLCPRCEGSFTEEEHLRGVLRQPDIRLSSLRPALLQNMMTTHPEEEDRGLVPCPQCNKEMIREQYTELSSVNIDRCPDGHGIWLDDGELGILVEVLEADSPLPPPGFWEGLRRLAGLKPRTAD